jgi:hypothetical protein
MYEGDEKCIQNSSQETWREDTSWKTQAYMGEPMVLNLWFADPWGSATPTQGVRDCLGNWIIFPSRLIKYIYVKKQNLKLIILKRSVKVKEFEIGG